MDMWHEYVCKECEVVVKRSQNKGDIKEYCYCSTPKCKNSGRVSELSDAKLPDWVKRVPVR